MIIFTIVINSNDCFCQPLSSTGITGLWKGSSICQVKNSPCHDEIIVYHVSKSKNINSYIIQMNKIVNGAEEEMGSLVFAYNDSLHKLSCTMSDRPKAGYWEFVVTGNKMTGKLWLDNHQTLYRIIEAEHE